MYPLNGVDIEDFNLIKQYRGNSLINTISAILIAEIDHNRPVDTLNDMFACITEWNNDIDMFIESVDAITTDEISHTERILIVFYKYCIISIGSVS